MINQINVKHHTFHEHALDVLRCGLFVVTKTDDYTSRYALARVTKVSIDPSIVSIVVNSLVSIENHLENCEVLTVHVIAEDHDNEEKTMLGEEMEAGTRMNLPQLSLLLKEPCALFNCRKINTLFEEDLTIFLAKVEFSRIDITKAPLYFNL
jgi:flavin reductase (DIM6/NTAB) family NADH-FMN oxidoreductase RutF